MVTRDHLRLFLVRVGWRGARIALLGAIVAVPVACGKKGPPLAPLHLVPGPAGDVAVRRTGPEARLQFVLPAGNINGGGPSVLDRVHIYAVTLPPGMPAPPNRELLAARFLVGSVAVKPPPIEGESPPADAPQDVRPSPGDPVTFVEVLTPEKMAGPVSPGGKDGITAAGRRAAGSALLTTALGTVPARSRGAAFAAALSAVPASGPVAFAASFGLATSEALAAAVPKYPVRLYAVQGMSRGGRPGQVSARAELPIVPLPPVPSAAMAVATEKTIAVTWIAGAAAAPAAFNVYTQDGRLPLNEAPIPAPPYARPGVSWGVEQCFVVRAVEKIGAAVIESEPSDPACVTPRDTFPPAAPTGLSVVAGPGTISLSWDANKEPDLGGYIVLRGEAPGDTLRPLTPAAIAATNYEDRTAQPGVRYVYSIEAIDNATPPNRSAPSGRVEETAR